ncbi:MAG: hypothetical protein U1E17_22600 [Geminicoccaceae bacterium]
MSQDSSSLRFPALHADRLSRRRFGQGLALAAGAAVAGSLIPRPALGRAVAPTALSAFGQQRYFAYPHQNAFLDGGGGMVLGQLDGANRASLWLHEVAGGGSARIAGFTLPAGYGGFIYYDIAEARPLLAASDQRAVWLIDLAHTPFTARRLYTAPAGHTLDDLVSIRRDGSAVVTCHRPTGRSSPSTIVRIDTGSGAVTSLCTKWFLAHHWQHSPFDQSWLGFSRDQGNRQRIWGHHPRLAPSGRLLWNQRSPTGGELLVGHEVWCRHELSILAIAYRRSPGSPRGLYQVWPDGRSRLVQAADNFAHCNVSRDGSKAVVDTTTGGIVLIDLSARAAARQLADTRMGAKHPYHAHPHFTPDGRKIVYTDTNAAGQVRVAMVPIG